MDEDLRVYDERWREIVERARRQGNAKGLPRPAGYEHEIGSRTGYALIKFLLLDGRVSCQLRLYRRNGAPSLLVGSFVMEADRGGNVKRRMRRPAGMPVAGKVISLACGRSVRVELDEMGLPYPVPVLPAGPSANAGAHEYSNAEEWGERVEFF